MKKILLLAPILLLASCAAPLPSSSSSQQPSSETSSSQPSSSEPSSSEEDSMFAKDKAMVYFFESSVNFDKKNPFYVMEYEVGSKITNPGTPASSDPAFNKFLGWSAKPNIIDETELWNFDEDTLPNYIPGNEYYIYGQWDYVQ